MLTYQEKIVLKAAPGMVASGDRNHTLWDLEKRGYIRPVFSYNKSHYLGPQGYDFSKPVYVYTYTEFGGVMSR